MARVENLLIANRGEIACRVMRTARQMGVRTIAVYSEADIDAPHVQMADQAVLIGPAPVGQSYLNMDAILAACDEAGADAVHPGYGFLSENADFARACEKAGLVFVGPPASAIEAMGDKAAAKRLMIEAGVPCAPGYEGEDQSDDVLLREGEKIGFPLMVKAAAGGGGRGMRLVHAASALQNAIALARSEAKSAFGSDVLILEKAIIRPRHIEIQVFGGADGTVVHFGERDCSVQRRHQKVLEEAPSPAMTPALRAAMGEAAVKAAAAIDYRGAGTVEFLLDEAGEFYFLEMNTRLQVEHPVTELVTGEDLVALQIKTARGEPLGLSQDDIALNGWAIEARLYAEDPAQDFLPSTGRIDQWTPPFGDGVRVDGGVASGQVISPFYDSMAAKIIGHGETREAARLALLKALEETVFLGPASNQTFLIDCLKASAFAEGAATTAFIAETFGEEGYSAPSPMAPDFALAGAVLLHLDQESAASLSLGTPKSLLGWASGGTLSTPYRLKFGEDVHAISLVTSASGLTVVMGDQEMAVQVKSFAKGAATVCVDGRRFDLFYHREKAALYLIIGGKRFDFTVLSDEAASGDALEEGAIIAPMHGVIAEVFVEQGQEVVKGAPVAVLEAMKMQHELLAPIDGVVQSVVVKKGAQVAAGDMLTIIEAEANN